MVSGSSSSSAILETCIREHGLRAGESIPDVPVAACSKKDEVLKYFAQKYFTLTLY